MFDKFVADSIICDQCQGSGRVGQQECTCRGGEVIAQAVRRLRWDDATGCLSRMRFRLEKSSAPSAEGGDSPIPALCRMTRTSTRSHAPAVTARAK